MYEGLELIEANPDRTKSAVMVRAGELRSQGYDKSDALSQAWDDILGDDYDEEEDDDSFEVLPQSRRRSNPSESADTMGIGAMLLLGSVGYFLWCAFKYSQTKVWSWQPWKTIPISRRITAPQAIGSVEPVYNAKDITQETVTLIVP